MSFRSLAGSLILAAVVVLGVGCRSVVPVPLLTVPPSKVPLEPLRIFWVNSYAKDDTWSQQVRTGLLETLARNGYSLGEETLEWQAFHMNAEKFTTLDELYPIADEAIAAIQAFNPDVVVVSDDEAARTVIPRYPNSNQHFVFCGLNGDPRDYGLVLSNVTGVLEELHPLQTLAMAEAFLEDADDYLILSDASISSWASVLNIYDTISEETPENLPPLRVTRQWFLWQDAVVNRGAEVDFILLVSHRDVREDSRRMESKEVMSWMLENSPVPVFALTNQAVIHGAVGGLVVYGYDQGSAAGELVVKIGEGTHPALIITKIPSRNLLAMNLAAVRHWNLQVPIAFPIAARVYRTLPEGSDQGADNRSQVGALLPLVIGSAPRALPMSTKGPEGGR